MSHLDQIYDALIAQIDRFGGSAISFSGDAITCWFNADTGKRATAAALATALWCLWPEPLLLYAIAAALVAASRVVMGAHYLSDVIMGAFIGIVVSRALAAGYARGRLSFRLRPSPAPEPVLPPGE